MACGDLRTWPALAPEGLQRIDRGLPPSPENTRCLQTTKRVIMGPFNTLFPAGNESFGRDYVFGED